MATSRKARARAAYPVIAGGEHVHAATPEENDARIAEIVARLQEIHNEHGSAVLPEELRAEWHALREEQREREEASREIRARQAIIDEIVADPERTGDREAGATFHTAPPGATRGEDIWDLTTVRGSYGSPEGMAHEAQERAHRAIDRFVFPNDDAEPARYKQHLERLMKTVRSGGDQNRDDAAGFALHILRTGSPIYERAFWKSVVMSPLSADEQRALSLTGTAGGFAVPITLDPTVIPTSNYTVNPLRRIAKKATITGTEWKGVTSGAVTASYGAELTEASDGSPTLAQPDILPEKCQGFIPYSIEIGMDWGQLQSEMLQLLSDAKDTIEATKFTLGAGHGSFEPKGLLTGATVSINSGTTNVLAVADIYKTEEALPARFRPRAQWMANKFIYNKVRQFDTAGGANLWMPLPAPFAQGLENNPGVAGGNTSAELIGYPANEATDMAASTATTTTMAVLGDPNYFQIVDRVGMTVEVLPHLLGTNRRPLGQRGLYAYWRNSSDVLSAQAFVVLKSL